MATGARQGFGTVNNNTTSGSFGAGEGSNTRQATNPSGGQFRPFSGSGHSWGS